MNKPKCDYKIITLNPILQLQDVLIVRASTEIIIKVEYQQQKKKTWKKKIKLERIKSKIEFSCERVVSEYQQIETEFILPDRAILVIWNEIPKSNYLLQHWNIKFRLRDRWIIYSTKKYHSIRRQLLFMETTNVTKATLLSSLLYH